MTEINNSSLFKVPNLPSGLKEEYLAGNIGKDDFKPLNLSRQDAHKEENNNRISSSGNLFFLIIKLSRI